MARTLTSEKQELRVYAMQMRQQDGWTEKEIALALMIPQQTISRWLNMGKSIGETGDSLCIMSKRARRAFTHNGKRGPDQKKRKRTGYLLRYANKRDK